MKNFGKHERMNVSSVARFGSRLRGVFVFFILALAFDSQVLASEKLFASPVEANITISGTTSFTTTLKNKRLKELKETNYVFTAHIGTNGYLLQLKDMNTNVISEVYSDGLNTLCIDRTASGIQRESDKNGKKLKSGVCFGATISSTPYPFGAPDELQVVWLTVCANSDLIQNIFTNYSPGIVFSKTFRNPNDFDWYHFQLREARDDDMGRLHSFEQWSMSSSLTTSNSLVKNGLKEKDIAKYYISSTNDPGKLVLRNEKTPTEGYKRFLFDTQGRYNNTQFPTEATLIGFNRSSGSKDNVRDKLSILITDIKSVSMEIEPPLFPNVDEAITIAPHMKNLLKNQEVVCVIFSDYRKDGINRPPRKFSIYVPKNGRFYQI